MAEVFDLFDWNGDNPIGDPSTGLHVSSDVEISPGATVTPLLEISASTRGPLSEGDSLVEHGSGAWTAEVISHPYPDPIRARLLSGRVPERGDAFVAAGRVTYVGEINTLLEVAGTPGDNFIRIPVPFPASATVQFRLRFTTLPPNHQSSSYLTVGMINAPDRGVALRFSQEGFSVVGAPQDSYPPLSGSDGLVVTGTDLTFRLITDADDNKVYIYVTETSQVETVGHVLRYSSPPAETALVDQFLVAWGVHSPNVNFDLLSTQGAGSALITNHKPVADPGDDQDVQMGEYVRLDGSDSYDPEGQPLTHRWLVHEQPEGSNIQLQDPTTASRQVVWDDGSTLTFTAQDTGSEGNELLVSLSQSTSLGLDYDADENHIDVQYQPTVSTIADVVSAITDDTDPEYLAEVAALITASATGTLVGSGTASTVTTNVIAFDPATINVASEMLSAGIDPNSTPAQFRDAGVYLDIASDAKKYLVSQVTGQQVTVVVAHAPGQNDDGYYAETNMPTLTVGGEAVSIYERGTTNLISDVGQSSAYLDGGAEGTGRINFFRPEVLGLYRIGLIVNDGELDSTEVETIIQVVEASFELGYVPDGNLLWKMVPDFWNLVKDKEPLATVFSSMMQVITGELVKLWQHDYSKSLDLIPRYFQRRWIDYSPRLRENVAHVCGEYIMPQSAGYGYVVDDQDGDRTTRMIRLSQSTPKALTTLQEGDSVVVWPSWAKADLFTVASIRPILASGVADIAGSPRILNDPTADFLSAGVQVDDIVQVGTTKMYRVLAVEKKALTISGYGDVPSASYVVGGILYVDEDEVEVFTSIDSGTQTGSRHPTNTFKFILETSEEFSSDITNGDILLILDQNTGETLAEYEVSSASATELTLTTSLDAWYSMNWEVIRNQETEQVQVWASHVFELDEDLEGQLDVDDAVRYSMTIKGTTYDWMGHIMATRGKRFALAHNWSASAGLGVLGDTTTDELPLEVEDIEVTELWRTSKVSLDEDVISIPRMQESPGDPSSPLYMTRDYRIEGEGDERSLTWIPVASGVLRYTGVSNRVEVISGSDLIESGVEAGMTLVVPYDDPTSVPKGTHRYGAVSVLEVEDETHMYLDWFFIPPTSPGVVVSYEVPFYIYNYGAYDLPPEDLWAEVTYYNNNQTIEDNFGFAVGLPKEAVEESGLHLDYLSSTKALWFALWSGPTISNIRLGSQVFFNLPFAEEEGTIVAIDDEYSDDLGRIVIQSEVDSTRIRTYFYPLAVGVDTNPDTGEAYKVGDIVQSFAPLSGGAEVLDYVKEPEWYSGVLDGARELEKTHTFKIEIDLDGMSMEDVGGAFERAIEFANRIKPTYTKVVMVGFKSLSDDVAVSDNLTLYPTVELKDDIYTTEDQSAPTFGGGMMPIGMRSGFVHDINAPDGEGIFPLQVWPTYDTYGRRLIWVTISSPPSADVGDVFYNSLPATLFDSYALRVVRQGPGYMVCGYCPWTFHISTVDDIAALSVGDTISDTGGKWQGWVIWQGFREVVFVLDLNSVQWPRPRQYNPDDGTLLVEGDEVFAAAATTNIDDMYTIHVPNVQPGDSLIHTDGVKTFTVGDINEFPDEIGLTGRQQETGPENLPDARMAFYIGGSNGLQLGCSALSGLAPTDIIWQTPVVEHPDWIAKVLCWFPADPPAADEHDVFVEMPRVYRMVVGFPSGLNHGDILSGGPAGSSWCVRLLVITGNYFVEPMSSRLPQVGDTFVNGYGGSGEVTFLFDDFVANDPQVGDDFTSAAGGSGTI